MSLINIYLKLLKFEKSEFQVPYFGCWTIFPHSFDSHVVCMTDMTHSKGIFPN